MITVFHCDPPLGTRILLDEQIYELVDTQPYTRKMDGAPSSIMTWETACPESDCGQSFRITSGRTINCLQRRCEVHKRSAKVVKGKRSRKVIVRVELP